MATSSAAAFLSYVHSDDDHDNGRISKLRERLEGEVRMHTGRPFHIFQDRNDLEWGQNWQDRIEASIKEVSFLIPVVTPSYFNSPACRREYELFLLRESSLGTNQLILPIYYLTADAMSEEDSRDEIAISLRSRQYSDWRGLRFIPLESPEIAKSLADLAEMIKNRTNALTDILSASISISEKQEPTSRTEQILQKLAAKPSVDFEISASSSLSEAMDLFEAAEAPGRIQVPDTDEPYKVYTTQFDEVISADQFLSGKSALALTKLSTALASELSTKHAGTTIKFERDLEAARGGRSASVLFLLDNSGSLRGKPISFVTAWSLILTEIFDGAGFKTEVVGFTTRAWKGGQSREKWLADGRPSYPGRLNDLRHIIYKSFSQTFVETVQNHGVMLREGLLKENVDGEALLFAKERLLSQESDLRLLIVISDGAPVDDSTLSVNGPRYLEKHLLSAIAELAESPVELMAVGIDTDVARYYGKGSISSTAERLGIDVMNVVRRRLGFLLSKRGKKKNPSDTASAQ